MKNGKVRRFFESGGNSKHTDGYEIPQHRLEPHSIADRHRGAISGEMFYYVWADVPGGENDDKALLGPYQTYDEAQDMGFNKCNGEFRIISNKSCDRAKVTSMMKHGRLLHDNVDLKGSLKRIKHKLGKSGRRRTKGY